MADPLSGGLAGARAQELASGQSFLSQLASPWLTAAKDEAKPAWRETWAGAIASRQVWSAYSGVTFAPFGGIQQDGFRFRTVGGYGQYRYSYVASAKSSAFKGTSAFTDLMAGYQHTLGPATLKALVGGSAMGHALQPYDPLNRVQGLDYGLKLGLESWVNLGPNAWSQLDASWAASFGSVNARGRIGYRIAPNISVGPELAIASNAQLKSEWLDDKPWRGASGGLFARYEWHSGELSVSGGLGGQGGVGGGAGVSVGAGLGSVAKPTSPYVSVNWLTRF